MAKKRDDYIVPMSLERTVDRLHHIIDLGIEIEIAEIDADTVTYVARRMKPRRSGALRVVDESRGQMRRVEDDHTQVEPMTRTVATWQLAIFYLVVVLLGLLLAGTVATATIGMISGFWQRALATLIVYGALFFLLQPQRFVFGSARDSRFGDFIHDVLKGPYADPKNLYEQYFTEARYWETHGSQ